MSSLHDHQTTNWAQWETFLASLIWLQIIRGPSKNSCNIFWLGFRRIMHLTSLKQRTSPHCVCLEWVKNNISLQTRPHKSIRKIFKWLKSCRFISYLDTVVIAIHGYRLNSENCSVRNVLRCLCAPEDIPMHSIPTRRCFTLSLWMLRDDIFSYLLLFVLNSNASCVKPQNNDSCVACSSVFKHTMQILTLWMENILLKALHAWFGATWRKEWTRTSS